jgi:RimJ/RimL family protein N-acetyltransferase
MHEEFEKYGFKFIRANEENIELIRNWRNSDFVRLNMLNQNHITFEEQINWFKNLDKDNNYFYIAQNSANLEYVGVAYVKLIGNKIGEPGFYLVKEGFENTSVSIIIQFAFLDFAFKTLGLDVLSTNIKKDNINAYKFNLAFCKLMQEKSSEDIYNFEISKENYFGNKKINKLKTFLIKSIV